MNFPQLLKLCRDDLKPTLNSLRQAVELESPSGSTRDLDQVARFFEREFARLDAEVSILHHPIGPAVEALFWPDVSPARRSGPARPPRRAPSLPKQILILGHMDTVWPCGTLRKMRFRIANGRAYGPGVFDMKAGIIQGLAAIRALQKMSAAPPSPVRFLITSDEETGSRAFRKKIESEARRSRAVLVLEPSADGALKTARKGVGEFRITAHGRLAHAGINPANGINAITELAHQIARLDQIAGLRDGITINAGVIEGGTRTNVVPDLASVAIDVRIPRLRDRDLIERKIRSLKPSRRGARLEIEGGISRPPMERKMAAELFEKAQWAGEQLGLKIKEASTGGGSDGNFTAALGIPTLDGLGAVGAGAHALHEHVIVREIPRRAALLAALLISL